MASSFEVYTLVFSFILISGLEIGNSTQHITYYVTPTYNTSSCPRVNACFPLDHYLSSQHSYFRSNTTFNFFEGTHNASTSLQCSKSYCRSNIVFLSNSTHAVIDCRGSEVGFHFSLTYMVTIENITFTNCGSSVPGSHNVSDSASLSFFGFRLDLTRVVITNSNGHGFYIKYQGEVYIKESHFESNGNAKGNHGNFLICTTDTLQDSSKLLIDDSYFANNVNSGLLVILQCNHTYVHLNNVTWKGNNGSSYAYGGIGGNLAIRVPYFYKTKIVVEDCNFEGGKANVGGGLAVQVFESTSINTKCDSKSSINVFNTSFKENVATVGGGVYLKLEESLTFCRYSKLIQFQNCSFERNSLRSNGGGGIGFHCITFETTGYLQKSLPQIWLLLHNCTFSGNTVQEDVSGCGAITLQNNPFVTIADSTIEDNNCTGISVIKSNVILQGNVTIAFNKGLAGGGMFFTQASKLYLSPFTTVTVAHNTAQNAGGGIYVTEYENTNIKTPCFFQFDNRVIQNINTTQVHLSNNSAGFAGQQLYGGATVYCYLIASDDNFNHTSFFYFRSVFKFDDIHQPSYITSNPKQICHCENETLVHCQHNPPQKRCVYPGQRFTVSVAVVGWEYGIRPGGVKAYVKAIDSQSASLGKLQISQSISNSSCGDLEYTIYSGAPSVILMLRVEQPGDSSMTEKNRPLSIEVKMRQCPVGFQLKECPSFGLCCGCVPLLQKHNVTCDITHNSIQCQDYMWIGYKHYRNENGNHSSVVLHSTCPNNYCKPDAKKIISKETLNQDEQCAFNRTGILCGGCKGNLSAVFGSSNCLECTNLSLFLILAFAFAGILLVVVLFALNLTVAEGTIHGLLFYANIVQANADTIFPSEHTTVYLGILKTFIAWINLDLGIETCFYNGMDALAKALLQFAFPLYIWSISGAIVFLSSRSYRISRLIGNNAVKVLATLIILSYAKLLRAVLNGLAFVTLKFNDANVSFKDRAVWELDGNVPFTDKKYLVLYATALAFGLIMLPFTLTLLFIQPLQRHSHRRLCCHIRRLMPFFDAYTGAYKHRNRFWPGMLLSTRVILLTIHALNLSSDPKVNMTGITLATTILLLTAWLTRQGIYRKLYADILEALSIINLGMLCSITAYNLGAGNRKSQTIESSISASIALLTFIGIVCFHASKQVMRTRCWKRLTVRVRELRRPVNDDIDVDDDDIANYPPFRRFDEDREPLLGQAE